MTFHPVNRFWGSRTPPKDRNAIFNVVTPRTDEESTTATIRLYGPIDSYGGWWGISAKEMAAAVDALGAHVTNIVLRINSPGGELFEGLTIMNMLRAHHAHLTIVVDGFAASAASLISMAGDEVVMGPGTSMMIHDARTYMYGTPVDLRKEAAVLDTLSNAAAEVYAEIAGAGTPAAWRELMIAETWYAASEAVTAGLADRVGVVADAGPASTAGTPEPDPFEIEDLFDLSIFQYAGRANAPAPPLVPRASTEPPIASANGSTPANPEGAKLVDLTDEQIATLREQVGFPENADATTITAALIEALNERSDAPAPVAALGEGMTAIPAVALAELQANAQLGANASRQLHEQQRATFLDSHRERFLPANRKQWEDEYDRNPKATREYLEKAPVLVPTSEAGHDVPTPEGATNSDDSWFPQFALPGTKKEA